MSLTELHLALLAGAPRHGYDIKQEHDAWFPDSRPLPFGQVYATLARLQRDGLAEVVETRVDGGPERTVYALTAEGEQRLRTWLAEPAPPTGTGAEEIVRKTIAALHTGIDVQGYVARQRTAHLRRMRELGQVPAGAGPAERLVREHLVAHLDADLRWLDLATDLLRTPSPRPTPERTSS
ncbi:PadR family transcriptional regulator [Modestobacter sp. I12A-02628]|uniref:PadR family transcriptional regulator n=1 Tax=Goekera deserti TaxID=2497753 RepID=A0A7K3WIA1_9ACTN|nr:PadR family transcriptional regulator [Goekera deserti]MPQ96698.1 PadR family transcriptional regulator [Goekera deserti]NDI46988.1 PadR family transcriptional regulator [Goekera deserti]NEL56225.1 PadR family transcriptional regulator [Goekera deserti]